MDWAEEALLVVAAVGGVSAGSAGVVAVTGDDGVPPMAPATNFVTGALRLGIPDGAEGAPPACGAPPSTEAAETP